MPIDSLLREAVELFAVESVDRAKAITKCVLELEHGAKGADDVVRAWTRLARELHTLKGTAASLGLADLSTIAHDMETLIQSLQATAEPLPPVFADAFLRVADAWGARVKAYANGTDEEAPFPEAVLAVLRAAGTSSAAAPTARPQQEKPDPDTGTSVAGTRARGTRGSAVATGRVASDARPSTMEDDEETGAWRVRSEDVLAFSREVERLRELRLRLDDRARDLDAAVAEVARGLSPVQQIALRTALFGVRRGLALDGEESGDLVQALEDGVKAICTLPVRTMLDPLHRVVRDMCRASSKKASLAVVGGDLAIDRRLLEALRGPLVQLVRNAVDHGVEAHAARIAKGKHGTAVIAVRVELQGNMMFVEVADDGAGMRPDDIRAAAVRAGVVTAEAARALSNDEVHRLVFRQGLSTQRDVSETSGRGVGLDLVLNEVRALLGHIDVASVPGQGTRFLIHVPVELGSSSVLIVRCGDHQLGVPMLAVEATIAARAASLRRSRRSSSVEHRDQILPLVDLGALLGVRPATAPEEGAPLLVFASGGRRCALLVDEVIGDRELVVRPLPPELAMLPAYQGAAVMAKGDLVLVLRADWLAAKDEAPIEAVAGRRVLVVDDSLTARALHRTILEADGFTVHAAASVDHAEEQLGRSAYDVIVCDLNFAPGQRDGLSLLQSVRANVRTRAAIFVMVSMSRDENARRRARELGADAWITKEECAAGRLLGEVTSLAARGRAS